MSTFVALLRAVNVAGRNRLPMADLRRALDGAGLEWVETYVQSGNLVFGAAGTDAGAQATAVHDAIAETFGLDVAVVSLTAADMEQVAAGSPFLADGAPPVDEKALHVTFFQQRVDEAALDGLKLPAAPGEDAVLGLRGRCVYLHLPHGYGRTKLDNAWFERALEVRATTRNWRTVVALVRMCARRDERNDVRGRRRERTAGPERAGP